MTDRGRLVAARVAAAVVIGLVVSYAVTGAFGVPAGDARILLGFSAAGAAVAATTGLVVLRLVRRRTIATQVTVAVLTALTAVVVGVLVAAQRMFVSAHDRDTLLVIVLAAGSVGVGVAFAVGELISSGTRSLGELARAIGSGEQRPPVRSDVPKELGVLADELHSMAGKLADSRDRERALESSRRELVAWVSHDLRTPLAGIRAMAEALEDGVVADPETVHRYHGQLRTESDRLTDMVDDLFELSRIHAGALQLQLERVPLRDLVSDALAAADPLASAKGIRLHGEVAGAAEVAVSVSEVSRVLRNLLHNAIRHTPSDGAIQVESGADAAYAYVAVHDSCGGIPAHDIDRVFDVAFRGETARTPGHDGGAGLGLAIARGIVEAHRGDIRVENTGPGCRFVVRLPMSPAH
ncbi:MAG: HAMP domain-containing sensor histidine kinase [Mycobacteriales bacterium]